MDLDSIWRDHRRDALDLERPTASQGTTVSSRSRRDRRSRVASRSARARPQLRPSADVYSLHPRFCSPDPRLCSFHGRPTTSASRHPPLEASGGRRRGCQSDATEAGASKAGRSPSRKSTCSRTSRCSSGTSSATSAATIAISTATSCTSGRSTTTSSTTSPRQTAQRSRASSPICGGARGVHKLGSHVGNADLQAQSEFDPARAVGGGSGWEQLEGLDVAGTDGAEMSVVEGCELGLPQSLDDCNDRCVDESELQVGVLAE